MGQGWICLHRKMIDWEWFSDPPTAHLFTYLLLAANHKPGRWKGIDIPKGGLITSRAQLAAKTGLSEQQIRTAIKHLISTGEVTSRSSSRYTLLIVNNYAQYQSDNQMTNQQSTNNQPATNQLITTNNNNNNNNNENNVTILPKSPAKQQPFRPAAELGRVVDNYTKNPDLRSKLIKFVESRKRRNKPVDAETMNMLLENLSDLAKDDAGKIAVVDQTLMNGWNGFFPISGQQKQEKGVPDWYEDTGENDEMDPELLAKALAIQAELRGEEHGK